MHMGLQDKLRQLAASGQAFVVAVEGPLTADAVVDAHVRALADGRPLTILHDGPASPVALRTAARFGATLVAAEAGEARAEAPAEPVPVPSAEPTPVPTAEPTAVPTAVPSAEPTPVPSAEPPAPDTLVVAASAPAPEVAHAPEDTPLPWDPTVAVAEPTPLQVDEEEFESMPWNVVDTKLLPAGRQTRVAPPRPTLAPDWGLPWPRPLPPTDALSIADPKLWRAPERIHGIREDLDRIGAPSFGVAKPEGSAWLKRLSEFGSP